MQTNSAHTNKKSFRRSIGRRRILRAHTHSKGARDTDVVLSSLLPGGLFSGMSALP
jgi:hypothetical protein